MNATMNNVTAHVPASSNWLISFVVFGTALIAPPLVSAMPMTVREILKEVNALVPEIKDPGERDVILERMATLQARIGDYDAARKSLSGMKLNRGNAMSRILVPGLINAGRLDQVNELIQGIEPGIGGRENALVSVAEAEARNGNVDEALRIAGSIDENWAQHLDALHKIGTVQASSGDLDGALKTLSGVLDEYPHALWDIVTPMAKAGDVEKALDFIARVPQDYVQDYARWGVVRGQIAAGDLDGASKTAESMVGRHPKSLALAEIARSEFERGKAGEGRARLQGAARIAVDIPGSFIQGDALWQIASVQASVGDLEPALETARFIRAEGMRQHALGLILSARADAGDVDGVRRTAAIYANGADDEQNSYANCLIAKASSRAGDVEGARRLIDTFDADDRLCALNVISIDRAAVGDITEALQAAREMESGSWRKDSALHEISEYQAKMGDVRGAVQTISQIRSERSKADALHDLAKSAASQGGGASDFRWASRIKEPFQRASVLLGIAEGRMATSTDDQGQPTSAGTENK
ncbi:MAG: tetratricopeptide repeat protein [Nitrospirota bacterium]